MYFSRENHPLHLDILRRDTCVDDYRAQDYSQRTWPLIIRVIFSREDTRLETRLLSASRILADPSHRGKDREEAHFVRS